MNITIIGKGAFGLALGHLLTINQNTVVYYDKKDISISLDAAITNAEAIVIAVPSASLADAISALRPLYTKQPVIVATKGITNLSVLAGIQYSLLSGPGFASDILTGGSVAFTVTSPLAAQLFAGPTVTIEQTNDTLGVALCGTLKNVYAIGAGILGLSQAQMNFDSYINNCLAEMANIIRSLHGNPQTTELSCGRADLILTCSGPQSRNYAYGQTRVENTTVEGLTALRTLPLNIAGPILTTIKNTVMNNADPTLLERFTQ